MEARDALGADAAEKWLTHPVHQVEYDDVTDDCSEFEDADDVNEESSELAAANDVPGDANAQNAYLSEFRAFYANYEEGADSLYYREDGDDNAEYFEEDQED